MKTQPRIRILFYTRQPFLALGIAAALKDSARLQLSRSCDSLPETLRYLRTGKPDILLLHLTSTPSLAELAHLHSLRTDCPIILWGDDPGGDFAFQSMHLGVRAFLPNDTPVANLLTSIISVHGGMLCFEKSFVRKVMVQQRITLTKREGQLIWLVAHGFKNKAIGARLGITEGTVKVYIYKLFKKLGVNDRLQMALYGLENLCRTQQGIAVTPRPPAGWDRVDGIFSPQSLPAQVIDDVQPDRIN